MLAKSTCILFKMKFNDLCTFEVITKFQGWHFFSARNQMGVLH